MRGKKSPHDKAQYLLSELCFLPLDFLEAALTALVSGGYRRRPRNKKGGGVRWLEIPCDKIKLVQDAIKEFLYQWPTSKELYGYQPNRSVVGNARYHLYEDRGGHRHVPAWMLRIDLKDAFPSVKTELVRQIFSQLFSPDCFRGYDQLELTDPAETEAVYQAFVELLIRLVTFNDHVPQGAPTSPYIYNLAIARTGLPKRLFQVCGPKEGWCRFTIYADDIFISTRRQRDRITPRFIRQVIAAIEADGWFRVNPDKVSLNNSRHKAHKITGVVMTLDADGQPKLTLPQKTLKRFRGLIYQAARSLAPGQLFFDFPGDDGREKITVYQVIGYIGWIKEVYKDSVIPASVRDPIMLFEEAWAKTKFQLRE